MSEREQPQAVTRTTEVRRATIKNPGICGLTLGDLRNLVTASESIPDDAQVRFENISKSLVYVDEWYAQRATVTHEGKP